jgi:hypothetical protein
MENLMEFFIPATEDNCSSGNILDFIQGMAKIPSILPKIFAVILNFTIIIFGKYLTLGHGFLPHPLQFIIKLIF